MRTDGQNLRQILAANLKEQRGILGISQEKLAEKAGLSWQTVNSLECQRAWASDTTLENLAKVFEIETFQLLMPLETRAALSMNPTCALRELAKAKKTYDETFTSIYRNIQQHQLNTDE
jgi:transcriptional regulator with XRE-family HTH domain